MIDSDEPPMDPARHRRGSKSLPPEQREAARAFIQRIVDAHFGGNESRAAKAFGISQGALNEFLSGGRGGGPKLLNGVAAFANVSVDVVLGRAALAPPPVRPGTPVLGNRPGFAEALASARVAHPLVPEAVWSYIANSVIPGYRITPESLYDLARQIEPSGGPDGDPPDPHGGEESNEPSNILEFPGNPSRGRT